MENCPLKFLMSENRVSFPGRMVIIIGKCRTVP